MYRYILCTGTALPAVRMATSIFLFIFLTYQLNGYTGIQFAQVWTWLLFNKVWFTIFILLFNRKLNCCSEYLIYKQWRCWTVESITPRTCHQSPFTPGQLLDYLPLKPLACTQSVYQHCLISMEIGLCYQEEPSHVEATSTFSIYWVIWRLPEQTAHKHQGLWQNQRSGDERMKDLLGNTRREPRLVMFPSDQSHISDLVKMSMWYCYM